MLTVTEWIDHILKDQDIPANTVAFCFNLYEDGNGVYDDNDSYALMSWRGVLYPYLIYGSGESYITKDENDNVLFTEAEVNETLEILRKDNPSLGTEIVRGGQFVQIPVRQPLGVLVADGYAAGEHDPVFRGCGRQRCVL